MYIYVYRHTYLHQKCLRKKDKKGFVNAERASSFPFVIFSLFEDEDLFDGAELISLSSVVLNCSVLSHVLFLLHCFALYVLHCIVRNCIALHCK